MIYSRHLYSLENKVRNNLFFFLTIHGTIFTCFGSDTREIANTPAITEKATVTIVIAIRGMIE